MEENFDRVLDTCLDRIVAGEEPEKVVASYPEFAEDLRPLLQAAVSTSSAGFPRMKKKGEHRQRFEEALQAAHSEEPRTHWYAGLFRPRVLAPAAMVAVLFFAVFFGVKTVLSPGLDPVVPIHPVADPNGNFEFLISDEVNAIGDFTSVTVGISRIGIQQADLRWIEVEPSVLSIDLTTVPGDAVEEMWQGDLPPGSYKQVFVYVDNVTGILKSTGAMASIKLPSNKLHISLPFEVRDDTVTSFTYDMTVVAKGKDDEPRYVLEAQEGESKANQSPSSNSGDNRGQDVIDETKVLPDHPDPEHPVHPDNPGNTKDPKDAEDSDGLEDPYHPVHPEHPAHPEHPSNVPDKEAKPSKK